MKTASTLIPEATPLSRGRFVDYVELTKPRVGLLVLFTVAAGAMLAAGGFPDPALLFHAVLGTALVVGGASALNQLLERRTDSLMQRTENRPLPVGRLQPLEVAAFGATLGIFGVAYLAVTLPNPLAAILAGVAFVSYVFVYTPLKRLTTLNTLIGAVPGALPPLIGWSAVTGSLDARAGVLFLIVYLWQVPHFLAIAWIYRDEYARAGMQMLTVVDNHGTMTGRQMVSYCLALIAVSLLPAFWDTPNRMYLLAALAIGSGFLWCCARFSRRRTDIEARMVLRASLIYLPVLLGVLLVDRTFSN